MSDKCRALFLDRDGVINIDHGYVYQAENFEFINEIFLLCKKATEYNYLIIVVTNQAGIGRGYYTDKDFQDLTKWMKIKFQENNVAITDVYYCPYHPNHGIGPYKKDSFGRKPNPGMLLQAKSKYNIDLNRSIMIGDKDTDMLAAKSAGVGTRCYFSYKPTKNTAPSYATHIISSLLDASSLLTTN
jgi:D-glycero-D-manno-heptose 1,7-bisphosphate phosphatase